MISADVRRLSTTELFQQVRELEPQVVVFDCDGTLWSGDAGSSFMRWSIESGLVSRQMADWMETRYNAYLRGEVSELVICGEMVQLYKGLSVTEMRAAAKTFFGRYTEADIFPEILSLITELQAAGAAIWAVSSTNQWVIEEGVTRFGIPAERVLAASVSAPDGVVGSTLLAVPTDEGKVDALRLAGVAAPDAVFGNSVHDAAMLAIARQAFPINPSPALVERSLREGWPVYFPSKVDPGHTLS